MKKILLLLLFPLFSYGQDYSKIRKNTDTRAEGLEHNLSIGQDSLVLDYPKDIYKVSIISSGSDSISSSYNYTKKIDISNLVVGDYTVMVYVPDKIIVFNLSRLKPYRIKMLKIEDRIEYEVNRIVPKQKPKLAYNLTDLKSSTKQSRADFRKNNLRPNGKKYD